MVASERQTRAVGWRGEAERWRGEAQRWQTEAQRWQAEAQRLGGDNGGLRAQVGELEGQVAALKETVATLSRALYGDSSEKQPKQQPEPAQPERASVDDTETGAEDGSGGAGQGASRNKRRRGQQRGSRGHGRRDYSHLPGDEHIHEPDPETLVCPSCGTAYVAFGRESCEQIDWQVTIRRVVHHRPTWRRGCDCPQAKGVVAAPAPPRPIQRGRFTSGFVARLVVAKFAFGLPVNRIVGMLEAEGAGFAPGSLCGTLKATAGLLAPVAAAIRTRNAAGSHLHVDETSWKVFEPLAGKANNRWWLWVFVGADTTVFAVKPGRGASVVADHVGIDLDADTPTLGDGRALVLSSDFYTPYQRLGRDVWGVTNAWCWAHMRRYFVRAGHSDAALASWAQTWLERIAGLFTAHRGWALAPHGSDAEADGYRQLTGVIGQIDAVRQAQAADGSLPAAAAKVLATLDREWDGLLTFLEHPGVPLDNNTAERGLRRPVVVRKNCYGSGAHWSAGLAADAWTILATVGQHGLNPTVWLGAYLDACAAAGGRPPPAQVLAGLLPFNTDTATATGWATEDRAPP